MEVEKTTYAFKMDSKRFKIEYRGSVFWLIFWFIVFFPIALELLFLSSSFRINNTTYGIEYDGSRFWFCFWTLVFFPIAFLLLFINGFYVSVEKISDDQPLSQNKV